jgi:L-rhamnose mutarotase
MDQVAFVIRLKAGCEQEYRRRHHGIWRGLRAALTPAGIRDYSIFLDEPTPTLFATLRLTADNLRASLPSLPIMPRWWGLMAELVEVDATKEPVGRLSTAVFHMD